MLRTKAASLTASGGAADDPRDEPRSGEEAPRPRGGRRPRHPLRLAAATLASPPRRLLRRFFFFPRSFLRSLAQKKLWEAPYARRALRNRGDSRVFISRSRTTRRVTPCIPRLSSSSLLDLPCTLPAPPFPRRSSAAETLCALSLEVAAGFLLQKAAPGSARGTRRAHPPSSRVLLAPAQKGSAEICWTTTGGTYLSISIRGSQERRGSPAVSPSLVLTLLPSSLSPRFPPPSFDRQDPSESHSRFSTFTRSRVMSTRVPKVHSRPISRSLS